MPLNLPPKSLIRTGAATADLVHLELTKVIAGHPLATTTYLFYEEIDAWLGPWGPRGYPIGYGKKYNLLFTSDPSLNADPVAREWVRRTTVRLQELLRDYLVGLVRNGPVGGVSINTLTEPQLREAAFDTHPQAYTEAGLALLAATSPGLTLEIAAIPRAEFNPFSGNFTATIHQVLITAGIVVPQIAGLTVAALMPAHSGLFAYAAQRDRERFTAEMRQGEALGRLREGLQAGRYDHLGWLDQIIRGLELSSYDDPGMQRMAAEILATARSRRARVIARFNDFVGQTPELRSNLPPGALGP